MPFSDLNTTSAHLRHAIKTAIAAVAAYCLTLSLGLKFGFWAVLSAVIVMQINVADSIQMCWYRFSGTAVGATIGMLCMLIFPDTPLWSGVSLFCAVAFCAYMTRFNSRYRMAAITVVIVILASVGIENRFLFSFYRVLEIGVGVACAFVVSLLIWPIRAGNALRKNISTHFTLCAEKYEVLVSAFLTRQTKVSTQLLEKLDAAILQDRELFNKVLKHERHFYSENTATIALQLETLEKITEHMRTLIHVLNDVEVESKGYSIIMEPEVKALASASKEAMQTLALHAKVSVPTLTPALKSSDARLAQLRAEGATKRFDLRKWVQVLSFLNTLSLLGYELQRALEKRSSFIPLD